MEWQSRWVPQSDQLVFDDAALANALPSDVVESGWIRAGVGAPHTTQFAALFGYVTFDSAILTEGYLCQIQVVVDMLNDGVSRYQLPSMDRGVYFNKIDPTRLTYPFYIDGLVLPFAYKIVFKNGVFSLAATGHAVYLRRYYRALVRS